MNLKFAYIKMKALILVLAILEQVVILKLSCFALILIFIFFDHLAVNVVRIVNILILKIFSVLWNFPIASMAIHTIIYCI